MKKVTSLILMGLVLSSCGFEIVDTGYRGVKTRFGAVQGEPLPEGLHFYNPFTSSIMEYPVRQETWESKSAIFTQDNQRVDVTFAVTFSPDPKAVTKILTDVGREEDLVQKIIKPTVLGSLQVAIGKVVADELNQKKDQVSKHALEALKTALSDKNVTVYDLNLVDVDFDDAYEQAAEQKVVAIQDAQRAKNETVKIEEEAKQTIATAKAEAESMRIKSQALAQNRGLVEFEIAQKWNGVLPVYMMGNSVPLLDLKSINK
jgi:prohibitin 2